MARNKKEFKIDFKNSHFYKTIIRKKSSLISILISFLVLSVLLYINAHQSTGFSKVNIEDFAVGMVTDRDVVSNRKFEYVDEQATEIRKMAAKHSVLPFFYKDAELTAEIIQGYSEFSDFLDNKKNTSKGFNEFKFAVLEKFPSVLKEAELKIIYELPKDDEIISDSMNLLKQMLDSGVVEFPSKGMEELNDSEVTILTRQNATSSYESIPKSRLVPFDNLKAYIKNTLTALRKAKVAEPVSILLLPFVKPNIIFDNGETEKRKAEALKKIRPVKITVEKNQKILRKGFLIRESEYEQLKVYASEKTYVDIRQFLSGLVFLFFSFILGIFLLSDKIAGDKLDFNLRLLIILFFDISYAALLFLAPLPVFSYPLSIAIILPTAFFTMLITALVSHRVAVLTSFILSLAVFGATAYQVQPFLFALLSGLSSSALINITGKRMDLIKTASLLAVVQAIIGLAILLMFPGSAEDKSILAFALAGNGFISGIFVLGFLPILEIILNKPTSFRLMELSDLNSPIMKKMLVTVAGTYNHSMMVAALAENACREIGANPLLARVGAYYHDTGKMENGEYFVENQTGYNKHLDINPRLSATVIRSHLKLGIEKAKRLRLPQEVIDIIAEHHGNGFIAYFYAKAKELDPNVDPEDFSYPGTPPRSKESAVVMLADTVEAACRTLSKPSVRRLEKFIDELVAGKIEKGQLDNSDLTFKDIKIIKESFVTILAGYYHSRIEYPNQSINDEEDDDKNKTEDKNKMEDEDKNKEEIKKDGEDNDQ